MNFGRPRGRGRSCFGKVGGGSLLGMQLLFVRTIELPCSQLRFGFFLTVGAFYSRLELFCLKLKLFCLQWESASTPFIDLLCENLRLGTNANSFGHKLGGECLGGGGGRLKL